MAKAPSLNDVVDTPVNIPASKLDADQYSAEDLDGVTESVMGSGNLNFMMMQAQQSGDAIDIATDTAYSDDNPGEITGGNARGYEREPQNNSGNGHGEGKGGNGKFSHNNTPYEPPAAGENNAGGANAGNGAGNGGGASPGTIGTLGGSNLSANNGSDGVSGKGGFSSFSNTESSESEETAQNGKDGRDGKDGDKGNDGENGQGHGHEHHHDHHHHHHDGDTTNIVNNNFGDVNIGDVNIGDVDIGDVNIVDVDSVTNLLQTSLSEINTIVNNLDLAQFVHVGLTQVNQTTQNLLDFTSNQVTNILDVVQDIDIDTELVTEVNNIVQKIIDTDISIDNGPLPIDITSDIFGDRGNDTDVSPRAGLSIGDQELLNVDTPVNLNVLEDLVGDFDIVSALNIDLLNSDNSADDQDVSLGLDLGIVDAPLLNEGMDINLDPVEALVGDVDLDLDLGGNLLGDVAGGLVDNDAGGSDEPNVLSQIGDGAGDLAGGLLGATGAAVDGGHNGLIDAVQALFDAPDNTSNDGDAAVNMDSDLVHHDLLGVGVEAVIDPVEDLVGDLDVQVDAGNNLFVADNSADDQDIGSEMDLDLVDSDRVEMDVEIDIDPIEALVGDVDLAGDVGGDVLGDQADVLVNDLSGGSDEPNIFSDVGDVAENIVDAVDDPLIGDTELSGDGDVDLLNADNSTDDQDITVDTNIVDAEIEIDLVEAIIGDVDLEVDAAIDLLNVVEDAPNADETIAALNDWTESTLPTGEDALGNYGDEALGDVLPEPVGHLAEGLGALDDHLDTGDIDGGGAFGC